MLKIEFPADRKDLARAFGEALRKIGLDTDESIPRVEATVDETLIENPAPLFDEDEVDDFALSNDGQTDKLGVMFNREFCEGGDKPFYSRGAMKGQWRKAGGVATKKYDEWYASELKTLQRTEDAVEDTPGVNVAGDTQGVDVAGDTQGVDVANAFANNSPLPTQDQPDAPTSAADLMVWVSEQEAKGVLAPGSLTSACEACQVTINDLVDPAKAATSAVEVYRFLSGKSGV